MVVGSLAVAAGVRAMSGRERPPMERSRCWPDAKTCRASRELNDDHTLIPRGRPSILSENDYRNARRACVIWPSFGLGQASIPVLHWQAEPVRLSFAARWKSGAPGGNELKLPTPAISFLYWEQMMSIFGKIMSAIFGGQASAAPAGGGASAPAGGSGGAAAAPAAKPAQTVD